MMAKAAWKDAHPMQDTSDAEVAGPTHGPLGLSTVRGFDDVYRQGIEICASNMNEEVAECRWNALPIACGASVSDGLQIRLDPPEFLFDLGTAKQPSCQVDWMDACRGQLAALDRAQLHRDRQDAHLVVSAARHRNPGGGVPSSPGGAMLTHANEYAPLDTSASIR
jgi:hypothetical protein